MEMSKNNIVWWDTYYFKNTNYNSGQTLVFDDDPSVQYVDAYVHIGTGISLSPKDDGYYYEVQLHLTMWVDSFSKEELEYIDSLLGAFVSSGDKSMLRLAVLTINNLK